MPCDGLGEIREKSLALRLVFRWLKKEADIPDVSAFLVLVEGVF